MGNTDSVQRGQARDLLIKQITSHRDDLANRYQQVLRDNLFSNRADLRPSMIKQIASDETEAILNFLNQPEFSNMDRGVQLHKAGLGERTVLRLGQTTRQFLLANLEQDHIPFILEIVDEYEEGVVQGFIKGLEEYHLGEIERTRNALQRGVN
ncbi:MAG TPA: hypothetical protein VMT73_13190 [Anaerolineales bacterium]|nr:hypothetical protein [Anaerolineales bacterium]